MITADRTLWCETCGLSFAVPALSPTRALGCVRCRSVLEPGTEPGPPVWLYAAPPTTTAAPTVDDARTTWSEVVGEPAAPPRRLGHYELLDELGRGGMGAVYRAVDDRTGDQVALKVLLGGRWADRRSLERFLREVEATARLRHPALARVVDHGAAEGQPWYAMELVTGPSLRDVLDATGKLPPDEALRIAAALARGLQHAHEQGLSHRDVKPENILIRVTGDPVLTDFGLVLEHQHARLTHTGQVMGTPAYLPPELARGDKGVDWPLVDIYALGAVLYEMLSGRPAYPGDSGMQVLNDVIAGPPPSPSSFAPGLPRAAVVLVERAMARVPAERFVDARGFAADLERASRGEAIVAPPLSPLYRARLALERHRRSATGAMLALGAVTVVVGGWSGVSALNERSARMRAWDEAAARWSHLDPELAELEAAGRTAEVDEAFAAFSLAPFWQEAPALVPARRTQAARLRARGDAKGELALLATAWVDAPEGDAESVARAALIDALAARWWYDRVETLALADARPADATLLATAAIARRDLTAARRAWQDLAEGPPATAALVEALLLGQATPHRAETGQVLPDGRVLLATEGGPVVVGAAPDLPLVASWSVGRSAPVALPIADDRLITWGDDRAELLTRDAGGPWSVALSWPESRVLDATEAQLAGSRAVIVAVGPYGRHLLRLDQGPTGWTRRAAHAGTESATSDAVDVLATDVDADGLTDLMAAMGPWNAFDVRWFEAGAEGELELRARRKLGFTSGLGIARWGSLPVVVAIKSDQYPSRRTFPADRPYGDPAGLYLLDPASGLSTVVHRRVAGPIDQPPPGSARPVVADLDGDGRDDIASTWFTAGDHPWLLVWRQGVDGSVQHVRIEGLRLIGAIQADDDPASELVVALDEAWSDEAPAVWVLGAGAQPLPELTGAELPRDPPPPGADDATSRRWRRTALLAAAGLFEPAARQYEAEAARSGDTAQSDAAWVRASRLWLAAGEPERSAEAAGKVVGDTDRAAALDLRASAQLRAYRFADAAATDRELAARTDRSEAIRVAQAARAPLLLHAEAPSEWVIRFDAPLDPHWMIQAPLGVRRDPRSNQLKVDVVVGTGTVAELPLERTGDVVGVEVEGTLLRVEWAAGIAIVLEPEGGDAAAGFRFAGWGGGSLLQRQVGCEVPRRGLDGPRTPAAPSDPFGFKVRLDLVPSLHEVHCQVEDGAGRRLYTSRAALDQPLPPGRWRLAIRAAGDESVGTPMHAAVTLDRLVLRGLRVAGEPTAPANRAYAEGALAAVLDGDVAPVLEAAALAELGRTREAVALVSALPDPARDPDLMLLLRSRPALALELREAFGDRWFTAWHAAWNGAITSHPDDPILHERARGDLSGLEGWDASDPEAEIANAELLAARGRARWVGGAAEAARVDLTAAVRASLAVIHRATGPEEGPRLPSGRQVWVDAHAALAAIAIASGDRPAARHHAEEAIRLAPYREFAVDRLLIEPRIAALADEPEWTDLLSR